MVSVTVKRGERHAFYRSTSVFLLASRSFASPILPVSSVHPSPYGSLREVNGCREGAESGRSPV